MPKQGRQQKGDAARTDIAVSKNVMRRMGKKNRAVSKNVSRRTGMKNRAVSKNVRRRRTGMKNLRNFRVFRWNWSLHGNV